MCTLAGGRPPTAEISRREARGAWQLLDRGGNQLESEMSRQWVGGGGGGGCCKETRPRLQGSMDGFYIKKIKKKELMTQTDERNLFN